MNYSNYFYGTRHEFYCTIYEKYEFFFLKKESSIRLSRLWGLFIRYKKKKEPNPREGLIFIRKGAFLSNASRSYPYVVRVRSRKVRLPMDLPQFQESSECDVCKCSFNAFRRRVFFQPLSKPYCHLVGDGSIEFDLLLPILTLVLCVCTNSIQLVLNWQARLKFW